jgi:hypothetical protein
MYYNIIFFILFIALLVYLFFIFNSIIWLKNKKLRNINDIIIKNLNYITFIIVCLALIFITYLYYNNYTLNIV